MKILVVGNGGREHALLWKLHRDAPAAELYITRGNGGTASLAASLPLDPSDINALAGWADAQRADLTIVGPENPLADGIVDVFARRGLPIFGPTKAATAIEASKAFAKNLMARAGVPTAAYRTFTELNEAEAYISEQNAPLVVKASGLAGGKGAVVCDDTAAALAAARQMLAEHAFGGAGYEIVVEECMTGPEISVLALTDGENVIPMLPAQDHKRVGEADTGPNTGGMGAYAPVSAARPELIERIVREIFTPTLAALRDADARFTGVLYAGLMLTPDGPKVVEFNARFGDPETEVLLPLLESSLLDVILAIARGESIAGAQLQWRTGAALTTVLAAEGYPGAVRKGDEIRIAESVTRRDDIFIFHAGTALEDGQLRTNGGRVVAVTGLGRTLAEAAEASRAGAEAVHFAGRHYRADIGWRELKHNA